MRVEEISIPDRRRNFIGIAKKLSTAEMEAPIRATLAVTLEDLRVLSTSARRRCAAL